MLVRLKKKKKTTKGDRITVRCNIEFNRNKREVVVRKGVNNKSSDVFRYRVTSTYEGKSLLKRLSKYRITNGYEVVDDS